MPMLKLYGADDAIEAHLLKHMLEQQRIPVFITGEYLSGAAGDVPVAGLIDVWVLDERYEEALDVLDDFFESQDGPVDDDDETDDELIGPDGYYNDDMEEDDDSSEEGTGKKTVHKERGNPDDPGGSGRPENPWNRVYRKI